MDLSTLTKDFEMRISQAEASQSLNRSTPVPRPNKNPDQELMRWRFLTLQSDMEERKISHDKGLISTRTTILSGDIHSCKRAFEELKPITLRDMKVPMVHEGRYLICQVIGQPYAIVGVNVLIQDINGDVEEVAIYNFRYKLDKLDWIHPGTVFIIKEPWLRYGSQSKTPSLRIDSPSDVIFIDSTDYEFLNKLDAKKWYVSMSKDAELWREKANKCFKKQEYGDALIIYDRAIRYNPENAVLYLNKSLTCLKVDAFYMAYQCAKEALEKGGDKEKALFRMGQASYGMREWQKAAKHFTELLQEFPNNKAASEQLKLTTFRLAEERNGKFNFKKMFLDSKKEKAQLDVADYIGSIKIAEIPGKGRGIIALKDVKAGTLLAVSKAFASGYDQDFDGILLTINLIRKDGGTAAQMLQVIQAMKNLQNNPKRAEEVYALYAGDTVTRDEKIPFGIIDAARIQQISALNRFASDDLPSDFNFGNIPELRDNSHLFILPSYFNHSCLANANRTFYGDVMVIHATVDIKKGDEICLSYVSPLLEYSERKKKFQSWKFTCKCQLCEIDSNDKFISKRHQMVTEFSVYARANMGTPKLVIAKGEAVLKKLRETYIQRNKFKIHLAQMLMMLSPAYYANSDPMKAIKYLQEVINLFDNTPLKYVISIADACVNLAHCYLSIGNVTKVKELIQKASELCCCTDMEHFNMLFPELVQKLS
uniref:SET domain-containing protein n=1 Tax=Panagrolaimus superbus TaxID=310955 RepID=A0A914YRG0_9BILA